MKETKIAKENIVNWKDYTNQKSLGEFKQHKQTCQRWLEFLCCLYAETDNKFIIERKVTDLKQAIKLYEDNGI